MPTVGRLVVCCDYSLKTRCIPPVFSNQRAHPGRYATVSFSSLLLSVRIFTSLKDIAT